MKIVNVRGTHGSGKSWVVRQVMSRLEGQRVITHQPGGTKVSGLLLGDHPPRLFVAGGYRDGVSTGGCDTFKDIRYIEQLVVESADAGHNVLYEGIRVGGVHSKWIDLARANKQHEWLFIILSTPLDKCWENVRNRRILAGLPPADEAKVNVGVTDHYRRSRRQLEHFRFAGLPVRELSSDEAVLYILETLGAGAT